MVKHRQWGSVVATLATIYLVLVPRPVNRFAEWICLIWFLPLLGPLLGAGWTLYISYSPEPDLKKSYTPSRSLEPASAVLR
jgi:hypothetical protein